MQLPRAKAQHRHPSLREFRIDGPVGFQLGLVHVLRCSWDMFLANPGAVANTMNKDKNNTLARDTSISTLIAKVRCSCRGDLADAPLYSGTE